MLNFPPNDERRENSISGVFAVNRSETLSSLNLRLMESDNSDNLRLTDHLKIVSRNVGAIQHRLVLATNGNAKARQVNQKQLSHSVSVLSGIVAQLEMISSLLPDDVNELESDEIARVEEEKGRAMAERSFKEPTATTADVPMVEMLERKAGRRKSFKPNASHRAVVSEAEKERLRCVKSSRTPQEIAREYPDHSYTPVTHRTEVDELRRQALSDFY